MRFHTSLEEIKTFRTISNRINLFTTSIVNLWHFANERNHITKEFHKALHTHILMSINTEHREDRTSYQSLAYSLAHLVFSKRFCLKEFFHKGVIILGCCLNKCLMKLHSLIHFLCRNFFAFRSTTIRSP